MPKTKIEDLPRLEDLDPEDQRLIRGGGRFASAAARRLPAFAIAPKEQNQGADDDIIVSRLPPGS